MNLYFAPLEGITTCTFRNTHAEMFGGCDGYFAPFITPSDNEKITRKSLKDVLPERNKTVLKAQVIVNNAECFLKFADKIKGVGYDEININLGCPSGTVVKKGRGAGFLRDTSALDSFFQEIFSKSDMKISVKTRTGYSSNDEIDALMEVYNKYPFTKIIVHPRAREDFYKGEPDMAAFKKAYAVSKNKLVYNGDVCSAEAFFDIKREFPGLDGVMIGRGAITNPAVFREIKGGKPLTTDELIGFSKKLIDNYNEIFRSETFTLNKIKEIWSYMMLNFPEEKKIAKAIKKANKTDYFISTIECLPERK